MCGIVGWIDFEAGLSTQQHVVATMNATIKLRGPDGEGMWYCKNAVLGHRRLAVIDLENGKQPMVFRTSEGSVVITYCGEIYNFMELRRELQAHGHRFRTRSDTEVILQGYLRWGESVVEKLRGMFAFAIWDERKRQLILARDHVGIKPLCYYPTKSGVIFGSEAKAVLAHPLVEPSVGLDGWRQRFVNFKQPGGLIWEGMYEVKPGTLLIVDANGVRERTYWRLQSHEHTDSPEVTVERTQELLEGIVDEQLGADVPVGSMLSGGIDSSLITAMVARRYAVCGQRVASYTVDFFDHAKYFKDTLLQVALDTPFAQEVAAMWNTQHTVVELDSMQLASRHLCRRVIKAYDMSYDGGDYSSSHMLLYERIRKDVTVILEGIGADELFGGYVIFSNLAVLQGKGLPWYIYHPGTHTEMLRILRPEFRQALDMDTYLADSYADAARMVEPVRGESAIEHRRREISYLELMHRMGYQLDYADRFGMAGALEVRVPFCDHRLIEYVYNVPWSIKMPEGEVKGLLRRVAAPYLPPSVIRRAKSPYPRTPHPGYQREIYRQVRELVEQPSHPAFELLDREWLLQKINTPTDPSTYIGHATMSQALEVALWFELYQPHTSQPVDYSIGQEG